MPSVNEEMLDVQVRHQVYLTRYSRSLARRVVSLLARVDGDVSSRIAQLLLIDRSDAAVQRLEALLAFVRGTYRAIYEQIERDLGTELGDLARYETGFQTDAIRDVVPVAVDVVRPSEEQIVAATMARPFQGRYLREWVQGLESGNAARLRDAIRMGYFQGETIDQIVRRVRGTASHEYRDGILDISKRSAETMVRTAVNHTANYARERVYEANSDLIKGVRWVSTLDGRTTAICRGRDGKVYPLSSGPRPPAHPGCRSCTTPVMKSWKEMGLDLPEVPPGTRASMNGQVPASETYDSWLRRQPREFVEDVLGRTRARLYLEGNLPMDKFVDMRSGEQFNLAELRAREAEAFKRAGV